MEKSQKQKQVVLATDDKVCKSRAELVEVQHDGVLSRSHHVQVLPWEDTRAKGPHRDMKTFDPDLLLQVLSYLPQTELFEVMTVCRPWEKMVMEDQRPLERGRSA